jgi:hypothetical protein
MSSGICQAPDCGNALPSRHRRFCCELCRIRGQRAERTTETADFGKAAIRMIQHMAKRVGASDLSQFGAMWEVRTEAEKAVTDAIDGLRASGFTWQQIAAEIGWNRSRLYQWRHRAARERDVTDSVTQVEPDPDPFGIGVGYQISTSTGELEEASAP